MLIKGYILDTLNELDRLYNSSTSQKKAIYYSKLAILEVCGWIEESMDNIVEMHCNRNLKQNSYKTQFKKKHIDSIYGFEYEKHFQKMMLSAIGIIELEKLETELEITGKISTLKSHLTIFKNVRNRVAHTFLKDVTRSYDAPSLTKANFIIIYNILLEIDKKLRQK